jgi:hypothetical protein
VFAAVKEEITAQMRISREAGHKLFARSRVGPMKEDRV